MFKASANACLLQCKNLKLVKLLYKIYENMPGENASSSECLPMLQTLFQSDYYYPKGIRPILYIAETISISPITHECCIFFARIFYLE